ncbi:MAG: hypothetical protein FWH18_07315 [Marinilabiliaceae bacterium]|nr:hypothetical protein [Marinilabiliaceae bacterium]
MTEITSGIATTFEGILWFIYRVLFTLLPSVLFFVILFIFCNAFYPEIITSIGGVFQNSNSGIVETLDNEIRINTVFQNFGFAKWIILLAIVFCINAVLASLARYIIKVLNFNKMCNDKYSSDDPLLDILKDLSPDIKTYIIKKKESGKDEIKLNHGIFELGFLVGSQNIKQFNNYFWFSYTNEYIYSTTAIVFILSSLILIPLYLFKIYGLCFWSFCVFQIVQLILSLLVFLLSKLLILLIYDKEKKIKENLKDVFFINKISKEEKLKQKKSRNSLYITGLPLLVLVASMIVLFMSDFDIKCTFDCEIACKSIGVFLISNCILFFICPILFLRAFKEFMRVEYLTMMAFAKDGYDKKISEKKIIL